MSLPTMSEFLEGLDQSRLLDRSQIEQLLHRPETAGGDLDGVSRFLVSQGWVTPFQFDEILAGRSGLLFFAGYRLLDRFQESPAGTTYKAYHPALQKPVALTMLRPEWLLPLDSTDQYLDRLQRVSSVTNVNLVNILDAGTLQGIPFVLEELFDATDLGSMVSEMGAVPATLGNDFIRQACLGVQAIHDVNLAHGDIHPGQLLLTPVTRTKLPDGRVSVRPAAGASVRVRSAAQTPVRPPLSPLTLKNSPLLKTVDFSPPERIESGEPTWRGDVYSLGACFYYLLSGRPPLHSSNEAEAIWNLQYGKVTPIRDLRSDVPPQIAGLISRMLSRSPNDRPASVFEVLTQMQASSWDIPLAPRVEQTVVIPMAEETGSIPSSLAAVMREHNREPEPHHIPEPTPASTFPAQLPLQEFTPMLHPTVEPLDSSHRLGDPYTPRQPVELYEEPHDPFGHAAGGGAGDSAVPVRRRKPKEKLLWKWILVGGLLQLTWILLLIGWLAGWFSGSGGTETPKTDPPKKKAK